MEIFTLGCIGQGWIGKNYADDFEKRRFAVVRYALEPEYIGNKNKISDCDVVFIAVPTPTTSEGFDDSIVRAVLPLVGKGKIAVIKSTLLPGTTEKLQMEFPEILILHSPEFLREAIAAKDVAEPQRNIVGIPLNTPTYQEAARKVLALFPNAPFSTIVSSRTAELVKYAGNVFLAIKVIYANMLYDLATELAVPYEDLRESLAADPRIGPSHLNPVLASGHALDKPGRGAGGHCFIKDLEAFRQLYTELVEDTKGNAVFATLVEKNNAFLRESGKDLDLLHQVYGQVYGNP